ncbi:hypothetical protein GOODEAATRI_015998 [Goodea atripinnis]|uniref:DRBM domain-containing protein n=1 Tax=Goodea atripinnis TaxID=208336 RepID=A0ABV0NKN7_9TELE
MTDPNHPMNALMRLNQIHPGLQYRLLCQSGPVHAPVFTMSVEIQGTTYQATGNSKRTAKLQVALKALQALGFVLRSDGDLDSLSADEKSDGEGKNDRPKRPLTSMLTIPTLAARPPRVPVIPRAPYISTPPTHGYIPPGFGAPYGYSPAGPLAAYSKLTLCLPSRLPSVVVPFIRVPPVYPVTHLYPY